MASVNRGEHDFVLKELECDIGLRAYCWCWSRCLGLGDDKDNDDLSVGEHLKEVIWALDTDAVVGTQTSSMACEAT